MLTAEQKMQARRFMGYPMRGDEPTQMFGYRFTSQYGTLEYRLIHLAPEEEEVVVQHINDCKTLEAAIMGVSSNLDTDMAAVWERNRGEFADRQSLYDWKRRQLCQFIGINPGPGLKDRGAITI